MPRQKQPWQVAAEKRRALRDALDAIIVTAALPLDQVRAVLHEIDESTIELMLLEAEEGPPVILEEGDAA